MRQFLIYVFTLGLLVGFTIPSESASGEPKRGGTLTFAISKKMKLMNPLVRTSSTEKRIRDLIFESLLGLDGSGKIQPNLAESWKVSKDGKLYTFQLRKGVKFHNGQEMTAEDAKFAIDYTLNPKSGAYGHKDLSQVEGAQAVGRYTLKIYLKAPNPVFPTMLSSIRSFSVVPKGSLEVGMRKPPKFPPGTGPFKFTKWVPGQRIVLDRFDDYWGHKAYLDRVVLKVISNSAVRFTTVRTGEVDLIARAPYEWIKKIVAGEIKGVDVAKGSFGNARNIEFNVAAAPFNNKKMRYAVAHALDRKEILNAAYAGLGTPVEQRFPNDSVWYFKEAAAPSLDLDKGRALLKEAGYKGEELDLLLTRGVAGREIEAAVVQAQLKRIGMKVKLTVLERGAALDLRRKGKFTFRFKGGSYYKDPVEAYNEYGCEEDLTKRIQNEAGYCSKEFDALLAKAETEVDPAKRKALVKSLVIKLYTDLPLVGIGVTPRYFAFGDRVKGFTTNQNADFLYWGGGLHYTWLDK